MSEAAPGLPDNPSFSTPERARLADAVRELIDAVMTTDADPDVLVAVADDAERLAEQLGALRRCKRRRIRQPRRGLRHGYLPLNSGGRFSAKALGPSCASSLAKTSHPIAS